MPMNIGISQDIDVCQVCNMHIVDLSIVYLSGEVPIFIGMTLFFKKF
jgi:hypothetical protein